jgi:enamine deaminase RidA (YjgF/YER057c/UK114 family)
MSYEVNDSVATLWEGSAFVMERTIINPPHLAHPRGFSHGILTTGGRMLFLAGQTASDAQGRIVAPGDVVVQYEQVLRNLKAVVEAAGGTMQDLVKITIFVRDRDDYLAHLKQLGRVHQSFFGAYYPATALFEISRFYQDEALIEIEGIAVIA